MGGVLTGYRFGGGTPTVSGMSLRIYLVDDNPTFLRAVAGFLVDMRDVEVIGQAGLGQVALKHIAALQPDVVLLDIRLPDASGIDVCRTLRSWAQPPQVVLVTLADSESYVEIARKVGALGFVNKAEFAVELPVVLALCTAMPAAGA